MLWIFIALKNSSPSDRFEPANLGSIGKNANHYTTVYNFVQLLTSQLVSISPTFY
jgi:hypothetical protein